MKIMFYINSIRHGGAERVMCNLATKLSEKGNECILATSFEGEDEYTLGANVKRVTFFKEKLRCNVIKRNLSLIKALRKQLKAEKPDVLISFMAEPNYRAIFSSIGLKHKKIISIRNDPNREYPKALNRFLAKNMFKCADGVVFQTEDAKNWFPKAIQKKSKIIFNQVDSAFYNAVYEGEHRDVVTTGRLVPQKNHKMLIRAFASVSNKISDNLIIYGEGALRPELEALISELGMENRIFLPGIAANVAETIKTAKLFVLSSDFEGMPNSLMEAMALGLPCISTDCPCGGPKMLFGEESQSSLVPIGNAEELATKMLSFLTDDEERKTIASNLKKSAVQFSPDRIIGEWEAYIAKTVGLNIGGQNEN